MRALIIIIILFLSWVFPSSISSCDKFLTEYANPATERGMNMYFVRIMLSKHAFGRLPRVESFLKRWIRSLRSPSSSSKDSTPNRSLAIRFHSAGSVVFGVFGRRSCQRDGPCIAMAQIGS
ncbi:hypothetical protein BKA64DRAFT_363886 [Cadophora sp. MPI-SDFR-AT-0126]|nr:hypothetical protein BKA64DRAFT_363886 [Leotiomycetes sp. MPI-SDFR-AT-0126]